MSCCNGLHDISGANYDSCSYHHLTFVGATSRCCLGSPTFIFCSIAKHRSSSSLNCSVASAFASCWILSSTLVASTCNHVFVCSFTIRSTLRRLAFFWALLDTKQKYNMWVTVSVFVLNNNIPGAQSLSLTTISLGILEPLFLRISSVISPLPVNSVHQMEY